MKRRRFALKANKAGRSVCAASTNTDVQTGFQGELLFYSKRLLEPLKQQRGFGSQFNLLVFLREKSRKTRRFKSSQHSELPPPQRGLMPRPLYAIFMLNLSLFCLRRQIGSVPMQRILKTVKCKNVCLCKVRAKKLKLVRMEIFASFFLLFLHF